MSRLTIRLLGPPLIELDSQPVQLGRHKATALLAYLALDRQPHSRDSLATLFWPDLDQSRARAELRRTLSLLNRTLGSEWLDVDRETAGWATDAELWLDVDALRERLAACATHGHPPESVCPDCIPLLTQAVEFYRDGFLAGFTLRDSPAFDEWQFFESESVRDELADALERLADWHGAHNEYDTAIPHARRRLALDPTHEAAQRRLMSLYARAGQRSAALRQYAECERVLAEELGIGPDAETTRLYQAIRERRKLPEEGPASRATADDGRQMMERRHNLPSPLTPFIGRETLLSELTARLRDPQCRLISLIGPGGSGKTRLALHLVRAQRVHFLHGVYHVPLAGLQSPVSVLPAIADAVGLVLSEGRDPREQLLDYLRQKTMLLLLDNFEHLLESIPLVLQILSRAAHVKVIATSRIRLNAQGEWLCPVAGLTLSGTPDDPEAAIESEAVQLFLAGTRRIQPGFQPTRDDLGQIVRICQIVRGMPLAILLAASWSALLSPAEIAAHLSDELDSNLDFLAADWQDVPARQRSLRAVCDGSWLLLTAQEQVVFQALSVFRGSFGRQAAGQVSGASLHELRSLANKCLIQPLDGGRFEVHPWMQQFAAEKLALDPAVQDTARDRHCAHYVALLERWSADFKGPRAKTTMQEVSLEIQNARAAWDWAVAQGDLSRIDRASDALDCFYDWSARTQEGESAYRAAVEKLEGMERSDAPARARMRVLARRLLGHSGFLPREQSLAALKRCLALLEQPELATCDTRSEKAGALYRMGNLMMDVDREQARQHLEESLALYRALDRQWDQSMVLGGLAERAWLVGELAKARQHAAESLAIAQACGDLRLQIWAIRHLGNVAWTRGQLAQAARLAEQQLALGRELGDPLEVAGGLHSVGVRQIALGWLAKAVAALEESRAIYHDRSEFSEEWALSMLAWAEMFLGHYSQARRHAQAALELNQETQNPRSVLWTRYVLGGIALGQARLDRAQALLEASLHASRRIKLPMSEALALVCLAYARCLSGHLARARGDLREGLQTGREAGIGSALVHGVAGIALFQARQADDVSAYKAERAVEFYALASQDPLVWRSRWFEDVVGRHVTAAAATAGLSPETIAAAQARGRARDLDQTVEELLIELETFGERLSR